MTFAIHTLGCRVNIYESEKIKSKLLEQGLIEVPFDTKADVYIINTCSVTHTADHKSRQMLSRARSLNKDALVFCIGCYTNNVEMNHLEKIGGIKYISNENKEKVVDEILNHIENKIIQNEGPGGESKYSRYFLKIEDGCNNFCSYCLIPHLRGRVKSKSMEEITKEARDIIEKGYKEIVLVGINLCSYGKDINSNLNECISAICKIDGLKRLRLSSLTPSFIDENFINTLNLPHVKDKICNSFHLSLQSASDRVLKNMNRTYTKKELQNACTLLKNNFDFMTITADIIVGFPGETEEDFMETYNFVKENKIYSPHVFAYSIRNGTKAASMDGQIPEDIKKDRSKRLIELGEKNSKAIEDSIKGTNQEVLIEQVDETSAKGYTKSYIELKFPYKEGMKIGNIVNINA